MLKWHCGGSSDIRIRIELFEFWYFIISSASSDFDMHLGAFISCQIDVEAGALVYMLVQFTVIIVVMLFSDEKHS